MRSVRFGLVAVALVIGCGGSDETTAPPDDGGVVDSVVADTANDTAVIDSQPADTGVVEDTTTPEDTGVADTGAADMGVDTGGIDMGVDTTVADTGVADTAVADTFVADTFVADTFVADTFVADTATADVADAADSVATDTADAAAPSSLLWFQGDFALDNTGSIGRFDTATAAATEVSILRGTDRADIDSFDVSPDGTKVAFSADMELIGRHDLYVMNRDGSGITKLVTPPGVQDVGDVRFSPDGTKIAFEADLATLGFRDVHVVAVTGGASKVVSPARPTGGTTSLQPSAFAWSRNSQYVAITGDLESNGVNQLWVTDATAATTAPVTVLTTTQAGTSGVQSSQIGWTAAGKVMFRGLLAGETARGLYQVNTDGTGLGRVANSPTTSQVGSFGLSADGTKVAFSADTTLATAYEIYVMPSDGSAAATRVTSGTVAAARNPSFFQYLQWSPNGAYIAFVADFGATDNKDEVYVVSATGGGEKRVAIVAGTANEDASDVIWSRDSTALAFLADHRVANNTEVFRIANVTTADQTPILVQGVVTGGDVFSAMWAP